MKKLLLALLVSGSALAGHGMENDPDYISSVELIRKNGVDESANLIIAVQRDYMDRHGYKIDDYSSITSLRRGFEPGSVWQVITSNIDKLSSDTGKLTPEEIKKEMKQGGKLYEMQFNSYCLSPSYRGSIDSGLVYELETRDTSGVMISKVTIDKAACEERDQ